MIEASKQILARFPAARIIVLSIDGDNILLMRNIGAYAYLLKSGEPDDLIATIIKVHAGEKIFPYNSSAPVNKSNALAIEISDREMQVLKLIAEGQTNLQIAAELNISPFTIKTHRQNLLHKFGASNTAQLIAKAGLNGLL